MRQPCTCYYLDGEAINLAQFLRLNTDAFSPEALAQIHALKPGESLNLGGGAGATFVLSRCEGF